MSILDGELAETIAEALADAGIPQAMTLTRVSPGVPDPETPWLPVAPTVEEHNCGGFVDTYGEALIAAGMVSASDRKIVIVARTLAVEPMPGDVVRVGGRPFTVLSVSTDPAGALYELRASA